METLRKLFLTGVIVPVEPRSPIQRIILMSFALATSIMYLVFRPFKRTNLLDLVSSYTAVFVSFSSLLLKFNRDSVYFDEHMLGGFLIIALFAPTAPSVIARRDYVTYSYALLRVPVKKMTKTRRSSG